MPNPVNMMPLSDDHKTTTLQDFSAYDLPSVKALIQYFHAAAGFPVCDTRLENINAGNFVLWPVLIYHNAANTYPTIKGTLKGHIVQVLKWIRTTKLKPTRIKCKQPETNSLPRDKTPLQELHIKVEHIRKLHTDDTERFPFP